MSKREIELFVFDIYVAIIKIEHTASKFDDGQNLLHDYMAWDSVIREFEIIGEASKYLLKEQLLNKSYQEVVDFRNVVIHEYFGIDADEVWDVINDNLPEFKDVILKIIHTVPTDLKYELVEGFIEDNHYLDFVVKALEKLR